MLSALVVALMLTTGDAGGGQASTPEAQDEVLRHLYFRAPQSDIVRDGLDGMLLDPLPFSRMLPMGSPDFDHWEGRGYSEQVSIDDPDHDQLGHQAVDAGACEKDERPCTFTFTYFFSLNRTYVPGQEDVIAIRYLYTKAGVRLFEGIIWGTQEHSRHFLRTATGWRAVTENGEKKHMNRAVELANGLHQTRLHELETSGRIVRKD
jgi:hypothetical protein